MMIERFLKVFFSILQHDKDYLCGQLDLGFLGKFQIAVFQNPEKQNEQSPDATIHMFERD